MTTERLLAFSDGVFAIAITLLVLDVRLPALGSGPVADELPRAMFAMWPKALAYALSFLIVAVYWLGHHRLFEHIPRFDSRLAWLNIFVLMFVAVLPVPTSILAQYGDTPAATILYAVAASSNDIVDNKLNAETPGNYCDDANEFSSRFEEDLTRREVREILELEMNITVNGENWFRLGEFWDSYRNDIRRVTDRAAPVDSLLDGFRPDRRPVLWRLLLCQACLHRESQIDHKQHCPTPREIVCQDSTF